jgi:ABC-2 type transport system permease protein
MYKLLATIKKETIILLRDQFGLAILFLMPIVLIIVMTLVQDAAFSSINERGVKIVLVDNDQDSLGVAIKRG